MALKNGQIDGIQQVPLQLSGNTKPTVVRKGVGKYVLTFAFPVKCFVGNAHLKGQAGDAEKVLLSAGLDATRSDVVYVHTMQISAGAPVGPEVDTIFSFVVDG